MKNFAITKDGKEYWVSRSVATVTYVFTMINGIPHVLANKRGPGLPNNVGKWNAPSGFVDYDETLEQAAKREVFEETGLPLEDLPLSLLEIDSNPSRERQIILVRYSCLYRGDPDVLTNEFSEPNEVDEVKWIPIQELGCYEWTSQTHLNAMLKAYTTTTLGLD